MTSEELSDAVPNCSNHHKKQKLFFHRAFFLSDDAKDVNSASPFMKLLKNATDEICRNVTFSATHTASAVQLRVATSFSAPFSRAPLLRDISVVCRICGGHAFCSLRCVLKRSIFFTKSSQLRHRQAVDVPSVVTKEPTPAPDGRIRFVLRKPAEAEV